MREFGMQGGVMAKLLTETEIEAKLATVPDWTREGKTIWCEKKFKGFQQALAFVNQVGELAEAMFHHPDILIHGYKNVRLTLTTHDAGGLTVMDFELAKRINGLSSI